VHLVINLALYNVMDHPLKVYIQGYVCLFICFWDSDHIVRIQPKYFKFKQNISEVSDPLKQIFFVILINLFFFFAVSFTFSVILNDFSVRLAIRPIRKTTKRRNLNFFNILVHKRKCTSLFGGLSKI